MPISQIVRAFAQKKVNPKEAMHKKFWHVGFGETLCSAIKSRTHFAFDQKPET